MFPKTSNASAG